MDSTPSNQTSLPALLSEAELDQAHGGFIWMAAVVAAVVIAEHCNQG
jgi:hypothetical protein